MVLPVSASSTGIIAFFSSFIYLVLNNNVCLHVCMCTFSVPGTTKAGITDVSSLPWRYWGSNSDLCIRELALLTAELSLQHLLPASYLGAGDLNSHFHD